MSRVAVMGAGSWGTAFAMVLADAGGDVLMWSREEEVARQINNDHVNERYHPGIRLPSGLRATTDEREALDGAPLVVLAVPAQSLRDNLARWRDDLAPGSVLVSLMKGIEIGTTLRMSQVIEEVAALPPARVAPSRWSPDPILPERSPCASPRRQRSPARIARVPSGCRTPARRTTSVPTGRPMSWASRWAGR